MIGHGRALRHMHLYQKHNITDMTFILTMTLGELPRLKESFFQLVSIKRAYMVLTLGRTGEGGVGGS